MGTNLLLDGLFLVSTVAMAIVAYFMLLAIFCVVVAFSAKILFYITSTLVLYTIQLKCYLRRNNIKKAKRNEKTIPS